MTATDIFNKVHTLLSAILTHDQPIPGFHATMTFAEIGADSLDHVEIIMAVEEEFGIDIPDEEADKITTVQQAVEYVQSAIR